MNFRSIGILILTASVCCFLTACGGNGGGGGTPVSQVTSQAVNGGTVNGILRGEGSVARVPVFLIAKSRVPVVSSIRGAIQADIAGSYYSTQTDEVGNFLFSDVTEGTYNVVAQADPFRSAIQYDVAVIRANTVTLALTLTATGQIAGKIKLAGGADPLGTIAFVAGTSYSAFADSVGSFTISGIPVGTYSLSFSGRGFAVRTIAGVVVGAGQTTQVPEVTLSASETFTVAIAGPSSLKSGLTATFKAQVMGGAVGPFSYSWTADAGTFATSDGPEASWTAPIGQTGLRMVDCRVTDARGATATGHLNVNVLSTTNLPPQLTIQGPTVVNIGSSATFLALANDPEGASVFYRWVPNSGTYASPTSQQTVWTAPTTVGVQEISCIATDSSGAATNATLTILIKDFKAAPGNLAKSLVFGGDGIDGASSIDRATDGNLFVCGYTYSSDWPDLRTGGYADRDAFVMKLDQDGSRIWATRIGGSLIDHANKVLALSDGGCLVVGGTESGQGQDFPTASFGDRDVFLARLSSTGTISWIKRFGTTNWDDSISLMVTTQGEIIVCWAYFATSNSIYYGCLTRLDPSNGTIKATLSDLIPARHSGLAVCRSGDGNIWMVGNGGGSSYLLRKFPESFTATSTSLGNDRTFNPPTGSYPGARDIMPMPDGGAVFVGATEMDTPLNQNWVAIRAGAISTNWIWREATGTAGIEDMARSVKLTSDNRIIIGGFGVLLAGGKGDGDGWIRCYDQAGGLLWQSLWGGSAEDRIMGMTLNGETGYYFAGLTDSDNSGDVPDRSTTDRDIWIGKVTY